MSVRQGHLDSDTKPVGEEKRNDMGAAAEKTCKKSHAHTQEQPLTRPSSGRCFQRPLF